MVSSKLQLRRATKGPPAVCHPPPPPNVPPGPCFWGPLWLWFWYTTPGYVPLHIQIKILLNGPDAGCIWSTAIPAGLLTLAPLIYVNPAVPNIVGSLQVWQGPTLIMLYGGQPIPITTKHPQTIDLGPFSGVDPYHYVAMIVSTDPFPS